MGCSFNFIELNAQKRNAAIVEANSIIEQECYEHGHGGYTGTFAEAQGCEVAKHPPLNNREAAEEWLSGHAQKWGPALLVVTTDGNYYMGANCSS
ncbi:hypothetical protein PDESU_01963 [Pontiella desulfatans]|uniref:Uncharacterized protein n=1 Tax=Pontiella desulfatans TaxID=2750659 RepID=A0A6C2U1Z9_PONDE|nr:hypothetical protein [Pontiella desulfatans]VGO13406.1 hypothetical protein PDESU_01963 [Pontiella desulfatans]